MELATVMPAKAGIHTDSDSTWTPAFAGVTKCAGGAA
jgi:hypothetical protein